MSELLRLFADNLLPVIFIAGLGFAVRRWLSLDPRAMANVTFYLLVPALVFFLIYRADIEVSGIVRMAGFATAIVLAMVLLALAIARALHLEAGLASAFILSVGFMNAGNFGLAVNRFAFGDAGLAWATVFFLTTSLLTNSVGAYVAAVGRQPARTALAGLLRIPAVYAVPAALLVRGIGWELPPAIQRPIELLAGATIPCMLILLGMQTAGIRVAGRGGLLALAGGLRLVVAPALAWGLAAALPLTGPARQAAILESGMPTAVLASMLATQYDADPEFVAAAVLFSTVLSPLTLTPLLAAL